MDKQKLQNLREKTSEAKQLLNDLQEAAVLSQLEKSLAEITFTRIINQLDTKIKTA